MAPKCSNNLSSTKYLADQNVKNGAILFRSQNKKAKQNLLRYGHGPQHCSEYRQDPEE
jgi:hypothetical protein